MASEIGGTKHDEEKVRYDLIPAYPLEVLAQLYTFGARKYADHNWRKGFKWSRVFSAMMRHAWKFWCGEDNDVCNTTCPPDCLDHSQLPHLAAVAWCAFTLLEFMRLSRGVDDRIKE